MKIAQLQVAELSEHFIMVAGKVVNFCSFRNEFHDPPKHFHVRFGPIRFAELPDIDNVAVKDQYIRLYAFEIIQELFCTAAVGAQVDVGEDQNLYFSLGHLSIGCFQRSASDMKGGLRKGYVLIIPTLKKGVPDDPDAGNDDDNPHAEKHFLHRELAGHAGRQRCRQQSPDNQSQYSFNMADTQYNKERKCTCESDKEFGQAYRADDVFRTTTFGNEGAGYQRPPAAAAEGVEKAAGAGKPAGTFYFLGFHFLFKGIN